MAQRHAVTNRMATKYRQASRSEKSLVLDQLVGLTGWHRDWARAQLRQAGTVRVAGQRKVRTPIYSARVVSGLERLALTETTAPPRPVNRAFNKSHCPEVVGEATNWPSRGF